MKSWLIFAAGMIIVFALVVRLIIRKSSRVKDEREWYVQNLNFKFSAELDTVELINKNGVGYLIFQLTSGRMDPSTEDSLKRHLKDHERLRFLPRRRDGKISLISGAVKKYQKGDSLFVNSAKDQIVIFRDTLKLWERSISGALRGEPHRRNRGSR